MRRQTWRRLTLRRETLRGLETVLPANVAGGISQDTTQPGTCCATYTNPSLAQSGACESLQCDTVRCH
jgi:hypothetical protein